MRPLETLLLLANLLTFLSMVIPLFRVICLQGYFALAASLAAAEQVLIEGARWQMVPAYGLVFLFLFVWHSQARGLENRKLAKPLLISFSVVSVALSISLPLLIPVFHFPIPSGPYEIGTLTYHWKDPTRRELFSADIDASREIMVQVWYPAKADASSPRAAYMDDADAVTAALAHVQNIPAWLFSSFRYVTTNARNSVPAASGNSRFPVLLFLEGATGFRQMNTYQVEELVSHGYIVAAIDQPGGAANVIFPDGHQISVLPIDQLSALIRPSYMTTNSVPTLHGTPLMQNSIIPYLTQDVKFTIDQLLKINQFDPNGILTGRLDLQHIGAFGVSLGGIIVGDACRTESRLSACLMMDAPMTFDVLNTGLAQPSMWITRDAESMRLERQRSGGWPEPEIMAHLNSMRAAFQGTTASAYFVEIPGTFHSNFIDLPYWLPLSSLLGVSGPIDAKRAHEIINAFALAFFDQHLKAMPSVLLVRGAKEYPDVNFNTHSP